MGFLLPSDYGLIGNQGSAALVSRLGSIDWCCLPFLDSPSHFGALLDEIQGGKFQIMPVGDFRSEQRYLQRTHVLETVFETPHGRAVLMDWMPMGTNPQDPVIHRKIEVLAGRIQWILVCAPRFDYGSRGARAEVHKGGVLFRGQASDELAQLSVEAETRVKLEFTSSGASVESKFTLDIAESAHFTWSWGRRAIKAQNPSPRETVDFWRNWAHRCPQTGCVFAGPWHDSVTRSGLVLKLLCAPYSGSLAEAVTTSVSSSSDAPRTWDYRYTWIRNSAFAVQALANLGYREEAANYFSWLSDIVIRDGPEGLQPVYTLDGGKYLPERELAFLSGYQGARPVRIGNLSSRQFELDIYGHVMLAASEYHRAFGTLPTALWPRLAEIADYVCQAWRRPDHGPWEVRSKAEHFTSSKVLCWAALDRAIQLARALKQESSHRWEEEKNILHHTICQQGYDDKLGTFVRAFGENELDASTLLIPMLGFLPFEDARVIGTLDALQTELSEGVFLHRYQGGDGIAGTDGAHLGSSFLYVSCLAMAGRVEEASDRLAELCTYATPLGLFGEQVDLDRRETVGNFPSAASHLSMVNAALYVGLARGRQAPLKTVLGRPEAAKSATPTGKSFHLSNWGHFKNPLKISFRKS